MNVFEHPQHDAIEALRRTRRAAASKMRSLMTQLEAAEEEFEAATRELSRLTRGQPIPLPPRDHKEHAG